MAKTTKQKEDTKSINYKTKALGLYSLVVALAELFATYIFVTQDNQTLYALALVFGIDAAQRLTSKFIK